jgi:gliding motility-associated-like protein
MAKLSITKNVFITICLSSFLFLESNIYAQNGSNIWYFGENAGIDFNGANAIALTDGAMSTVEGCATVSNTTGELLFYTNGATVWNKNHLVMPNGINLAGNTSSSQAASIVQLPNSTSIYYIFTIDYVNTNYGLSYSLVDLTLDNGLGDVMATKNQYVVGPSTEKIAIIKHQNNIDYWIVVRLNDSRNFHSYLLTSSGLADSPVVNTVGDLISSSNKARAGCMKSSLDGKKLATAYVTEKYIDLFDFDNVTGILSNRKKITRFKNNAFINYGVYGVEFSPNRNFLYASKIGDGYIYQYDITSNITSQINNSVEIIGNATNTIGTLQLAPDNKIYLAQLNEPYLGVIKNPNGLGTSSNYVNNGFNLQGKISTMGLPAFVNVIDKTSVSFNATNLCLESNTLFEYDTSSPITSVLWDFGDSGSGVNNTSTLSSPIHVYNAPGIYMVNLTTYYNGEEDVSVRPIEIYEGIFLDLGPDRIICEGETTLLDATTENATYVWQDNSTNPTLTVHLSGDYWVEITAGECTLKEEINIEYKPSPVVDFGSDLILCEGENTLLDATVLNATYLWQDNSNNAIFNVTVAGYYWVEVTIDGCTFNEDIIVNHKSLPAVDLGDDISLCDGQMRQLDATTANASYLWQDNTTKPIFNVNMAGDYWVEVTVDGCVTKEEISVEYKPFPSIDFGADLILCDGDISILDATTTDATYNWQDNSTSAIYNVNQAGDYWVEVTVNECVTKEEIKIDYKPMPIVDLGDDISLCDGETTILGVTFADATYRWQDGTTNQTFSVSQAGDYWVEVTVNGCVVKDDITVDFNSFPELDFGNDLVLCEGEETILDATISNATYLWQNNFTGALFNVNQAGNYWVEVTLNECTSREEITVNYNPLPIVNLGNDFVLCDGEISILDATKSNATYEWQDNSTSPTFEVNQEGEYWVKVTIDGCTSLEEITVDYNPFPTIDLGNDLVLCDGETTMLDATTVNATYIWQDNSNDPTFEVNQAGDYWVDLTVGGCTTKEEIKVDYNPLPVIDLGDDLTLCEGDIYTIDVTTSNATYVWHNNATGATFNVVQTGDYWVSVTVDGCIARDEIEVVYYPYPIIDLGNDLTLCDGETSMLDATTINGTYLWQDNTKESTYNVIQAGDYWVEVTTNGCTTKEEIKIQYNPLPVLDLGYDIDLCDGETTVINATTVNATYLWQDNFTDAVYNITQEGEYWVEVTVDGCTITEEISVTYYPFPEIDLGKDSTLCDGQTLLLEATTTDATYFWQDNSSVSTFIVNQAGEYWVELTTHGCTTKDEINIDYNPVPDVDLGKDLDLCEEETIILDVTLPNATYEWQDHTTQPLYAVSKGGGYQVKVTVDNCSTTDLKKITYTLFPRVDLGPDLTPCEGETVILEATNISAQYTWHDGSTHAKQYVRESGEYSVDVINRCGAISDKISLEFRNCNCGLFVPGAFTPYNNDRTNDNFKPIASCEISEYSMRIYDLWGELVFETFDINESWDGIKKDVLCKNGVYAYHINYRNELAVFEMVSGYVTLLR